MRAALPGLALVAACSGAQHHHPGALPPRAACAAGAHPGVASRAVAWGGDGWGAVSTDQASLFLVELTPDGAARGVRRPLLQEPSPWPPPRVGLARAAGAWYAVVAPRMGGAGGAAAQVVRLGDGDAAQVFPLGDAVAGDVAAVAREDAAAPVAVFYGTAAGTALRLLGRSGEPAASGRCPADIDPRDVVALDDGFRALALPADPTTGEARGVDVVALDSRCGERWRTHVWEGALNGRVQALAAAGDDLYVAFGDREGDVWLGALTADGGMRLRARRLLRGASTPRLLAREGGRGVRVVAVRSDEAADRVDACDVDADGLLEVTRNLAASPSAEVQVVAPDPWGGALVGWSRPEPTHGAIRPGLPSQYSFLYRLCP